MPSITGGTLIRNSLRPGFGGTLGCVVVSQTDPSRRYILTAGHVISRGGYAQDGESIEACTPGGWIKVGEFEKAVKLRDIRGVPLVCDAAIARITHPDVVNEIGGGIGEPAGSNPRAFVGSRLRFVGAPREGQVIEAELRDTDREVPIFYENVAGGVFCLDFRQQLIYGVRAGEVWTPAAHDQDSGALILDQDNIAIGLHLGRTPDDFEVAASVCTPIRVVLDALGVRLPREAWPPAQAVAIPLGATPATVPALDREDRIGVASLDQLGMSIRSLMEPHNEFGGVPWLLTARGLVVDGRLDRSAGALVTVPRVWQMYRTLMEAAAYKYRVPVELILATACTESSGNASAIRLEPRYVSDEATPGQVSPGLMQTLISTARSTTGNAALTRADLLDAAVSIDAGTCYIDQQRLTTRLDPPKVACAYNAGRLCLNSAPSNRWRMRQYPIGTGAHADRFINWFNDCFAYFAEDPRRISATTPSYFRLMNEQ